ncbi:hypothetical protein P4V41_08035 [Fictibacillus nanhaiensis]|uniref:hypothetical protein n=1 Tax=Fictibacillus nanhaiensis TaxID=742169 RepID=UPI002E20C0A7|nr:hypothetical protein [Fictibacillus nanhaiensis]
MEKLMEKCEELSSQQVIDIIKAYYTKYGRNWDDFAYLPKIEDGMFHGLDVYKKLK